jgi:putative endonuclease
MPDTRREHGRVAEDAAAAYLVARGIRVIDRNVRFPHGEIDLVAHEGATWVFVEVKSRRADWGDPATAAVTAAKRRRLGRLAQHYLKWKGLGQARCRFDVIAVTLDREGRIREVRHLPAAFAVEAW